MNCWIFLDDDTREEIDREIAGSRLELDLLSVGDVYICPNNFQYVIKGSYKVLNSRRGHFDKYLLCVKHTSDSGSRIKVR